MGVCVLWRSLSSKYWVSTSLCVYHLCVMFFDSKRVQLPQRIPRHLSIKPHNRREENRLRSEPKQREDADGRGPGRLEVQSWAVFLIPMHWPQTRLLILSLSLLRALKPVCVGLEIYGKCQHRRLLQNCCSLLVKYSYISTCTFKVCMTAGVCWRKI